MLRLVVVSLLVLGALAQGRPGGFGRPGGRPMNLDKACENIKTRGCPTPPPDSDHSHEVCGADGKTYDSPCALMEQVCKDRKLSPRPKHMGSCEDGPPTGMPGQFGGRTRPPMDCSKMKDVKCRAFNRPLCGSDGTTYKNICFFRKAKCADDTLTVKKFGDCGN